MEHLIKSGESLSSIARIHNITLSQLLAENPQYKADPNHIRVGASLSITNSSGSQATQPEEDEQDSFAVPRGQLTFDAEGLETRGKYFSRSPHVPGAWSGVTIGRGYDMRERSANEIIDDLTYAKISQDTAEKLSSCRGLRGAKARKFLQQKNFTTLEITPAQQKALFSDTYQELEGDVIRICSKHDVVNKYGTTDWDNLHPLIKDIVVDLRYRGDYTGATREVVQPVIINNSLDELVSVMTDRHYWVNQRNVPVGRFNLRKRYVAH